MSACSISSRFSNGALGWLVSFNDPDGLQLKIYSDDAHGLSREQLASVATPVDGANQT